MKKIYRYVVFELLLLCLLYGWAAAAEIEEIAKAEEVYGVAEIFLLGIGVIGLAILRRKIRSVAILIPLRREI